MLLNSSRDSFQNQFKNKLSNMLSTDELGSFILVLANSMQDAQLQKSLTPELETVFNGLKANQNLKSAPDDSTVFEALKSTGISHFSTWESRQIDHWQCVFNPLRALRPGRVSKEVFNGLHRPFNHDGFHFSKPFLRPEILSEDVFENTNMQLCAKLTIMYHKFPLAPFHLLIVVEAAQHRPQYLDQDTHQITWDLAEHVEKNINGFGLSFNSLGAGASVNQLHIHGFVDDLRLAIEQPYWKHNGGTEHYPLKTNHFSSVQESWDLIEQLHHQNQPYNLLYRASICYVIQRKPQGSVELPAWLSNVGWYEACGGFNLSNENYYQSLTADNIQEALSEYN